MTLNITLFDENYRNLLSILFDKLRINFFAIDKDGYYIARNATLTNIVGETELADKIDKKAWDSCLRIMQTEKHEIVEEEYNGQWFLSCKAPLYIDGDVMGVIGVAVDITEKKQAEIAKTQFIENMSHDLRTPFSGIISLSEYLHSQEQEPTKKGLLGEIINSGNRLLSLLNQVLEISQQGSHPITLTEFKLAEVIQEAIELVHAEAIHKKLEINVCCPEVIIKSDRMRVSRILINLFGNAVKYTSKGSISIKVHTNSPLQIAIEDTGVGIPNDALETIFKRFSKLHPSYIHQNYDGAGIGLHIAREFARELGGDINVTSAVGKGSCFTFVLNKEQSI